MKKKKLTLKRTTVRDLTTAQLEPAQGASFLSYCNSYCAGSDVFCHSDFCGSGHTDGCNIWHTYNNCS